MPTTIVPPYAGESWSNYTDINKFPYIWTAYRHRPLSGEIVMQMGSVQGATDLQLGIMKIGFQHTFRTSFGGTAQIVVDVNPGPISRRGISFCRVEANLKGPGAVNVTAVDDVFSYRPLALLVEANVKASSTYTLTFYGHMQINVLGGESAYGEIITTFPKISRFGAAQAAVAAAARESEATEDPRMSTMKRSKPTLTQVSLEEAYGAGAEGFEGGTEGGEPVVPGKRASRRK